MWPYTLATATAITSGIRIMNYSIPTHYSCALSYFLGWDFTPSNCLLDIYRYTYHFERYTLKQHEARSTRMIILPIAISQSKVGR